MKQFLEEKLLELFPSGRMTVISGMWDVADVAAHLAREWELLEHGKSDIDTPMKFVGKT